MANVPLKSLNFPDLPNTYTIPTKTSDLTNDSGFITSAPVASVDGKTGAVTVLPTGGSTGQVLAKASATDRDVEWITPSGGGGIISNANVLLASGTADAGITSATVGDGLVDTGLTLGDLRQYKYVYIKIRLDDNKPYLGFRIGNLNCQYAVSNAVYMQFTWLDNAKTALMPISCGAGISGIAGNPDRIANNIYFAMSNSNQSARQWLGAISIASAADTDKIYVGITNMNGLAETTKSMIWGVFGMGAYS